MRVGGGVENNGFIEFSIPGARLRFTRYYYAFCTVNSLQSRTENTVGVSTSFAETLKMHLLSVKLKYDNFKKLSFLGTAINVTTNISFT